MARAQEWGARNDGFVAVGITLRKSLKVKGGRVVFLGAVWWTLSVLEMVRACTVHQAEIPRHMIKLSRRGGRKETLRFNRRRERQSGREY